MITLLKTNLLRVMIWKIYRGDKLLIERLQDTRAILQVLGCIIQNPNLLVQYDYLNLDKNHFPEMFHKIIFATISNLFSQGVEKIDALTIDSFLVSYKKQHEIFEQNNGIKYIEDAIELAQPENFEYNAKRVIKYSILRDLVKKGYDISKFYDENDEEKMLNFDNMTIEQMFEVYERELIDLKLKYTINRRSIHAGKGLQDLKERYKSIPEMGIPFPSNAMSVILRGFRKGKLYLHSALSGRGKSRMMASCAAYQAVKLKKPVLFITSEQQEDEIQTMFLAYISQVDEEKILLGQYSKEEEKKVDEAIKLIETSPLYVEFVSDFTPEKIENVVKHHKMIHDIEYVYFDYIKATVEMLSDLAGRARVSNLRTDNVLYMFTEKLKRLANNLDIGIYTATQLNAEAYNAKEFNEKLLRGAKAIADPVDVGMIIREVDKSDETIFEGILEEYDKPDLCLCIYKNRRGKKDIDIWMKIDHGTCTYQDVLVTQHGRKLEIPKLEIEYETQQNKDEWWCKE